MSQKDGKPTEDSEPPKETGSRERPNFSELSKAAHAGSEPILVDFSRPIPSSQQTPQRTQSESAITESDPSPSEQSGAEAKERPTSPSHGQKDETFSKIGANAVRLSESMRRIVMWTMTGFFDWNPYYMMRMRGIMNLIQMILCLTAICLLASICRLENYIGGSSDEFMCKPPETFLLVVSCGAFFTTILYFFCCLLSKRTDALLFETSFEISYFVLYFLLLLTASITLLISSITGESNTIPNKSYYKEIQTIAIVSLVNSIMYGISAIWFLISHRYYQDTSEAPPETP